MGKVQFGQEATTPSTPAATKLTLYQGSDGKLYTIDSAGAIVNLTDKGDKAALNLWTKDNVYLAPIVAVDDLLALNPTPIASYTASQLGTTVTATVGTFSAADVGRIFVWTTAAILYVRISAYISPTQVTVDHSETIASQAGTTYGPPLLYVDPVAPAIYSDLTAKTTPVDTDNIIINDSAATNIWKIVSFANIWSWIQTKAAAGITSIFKFMTYIDFPFAGQIYQYTTGGALIRGYTDIEVNMNGAKTITAASWAAGVITFTVTGHELSNPVTTDRITTVCNPAGFSLTKATPVWISATQYQVTAPDPGAAFVSGTSYTLNLYEKFETVNAAVSVTTGIWANRDTAALCKFTGYTEGGIDRWFQDNTTTVGTVPSWGNAKMILDTVNGRLAIGASTMPATSIYTNTGYFASTLQSIGAFYHNSHINTQNKTGAGFLQWVTRTTTGAEAALQLAYIELVNFVAVTLPAIVAGRLEWDGTDLWFSESATVRSPVNNSKYLINAQVGTTYTFVLADKGYLVSFANAAAITATVPPNSSVAFPIGTRIRVIQDGAGKLTIAAGVGVTINSLAGNKAMAGQYSDAELVKEATDTWYLTGNLIA